MTNVACHDKSHLNKDCDPHLQNEFPIRNAWKACWLMLFYLILYFLLQQYAYFNFLQVTKLR